MSGSGISYFKNSPGQRDSHNNNNSTHKKDRSNVGEADSSNSEIKKLLDSLIASKSQYEEKRKTYFSSKE